MKEKNHEIQIYCSATDEQIKTIVDHIYEMMPIDCNIETQEFE